MRIDQAKNIIEWHITANQPIMIDGPPGVGKTELVNQIAAARGWPCIEFIASLRDPVDLRGVPDIDRVNSTTRWLAPSELPRTDRDGQEGIFFCDEITNSSPSMQGACYGLVHNGIVGEFRFPNGWRRVAAGNRQADRAVANRMSSALAGRMAHVTIEPDSNVWLLWAAGNGVAEMVRAFIAWRSNLLYIAPREGDSNARPSPRSWTRAARVMLANPTADPVEIVRANVGAPADEFRAFAASYAHLSGLIPKIMADPDTAPLPPPTEASVLWAIAMRLADMATLANFGTLGRYLARMIPEFEIMAVTSAVRRLPDLKAHAAATAFAVRNQHVTL